MVHLRRSGVAHRSGVVHRPGALYSCAPGQSGRSPAEL